MRSAFRRASRSWTRDASWWPSPVRPAPVPLKRQGTPEEVAPGILYLASNASSYVTDQELVTDGGLFLRRVLVSNLCRF